MHRLVPDDLLDELLEATEEMLHNMDTQAYHRLRAARGAVVEMLEVGDAQCGDWPAPCNCDDPVTHNGH